MLTALHILEAALPMLYLAAFAVYLRYFLTTSPTEEAQGFWGTKLLWGVIATHVLYLVLRGGVYHAFPLAARPEFLTLLALSVSMVYALGEWRTKEHHTGMFFLGISFTFQILASGLMEDPDAQSMLLEHPSLQNPIFAVHVVAMLLAFSALAVGALYAMMYILMERQLKARELGLFFKRLPPLLKLESMSNTATVTGVVLLGLGLGLGHFVALYLGVDYDLTDPKVLIMDLAWLGYILGAVVVKVRAMGGLFSGYLALGGYVTLMSMVALSNFIATSFHSFH
ncbi:MAG: cytochrome c biogenesis protein CcsA [Myxococcota bacterium]